MAKHFKVFELKHHDVIVFKKDYSGQTKINIVSDQVDLTNMITFPDGDGGKLSYEQISEENIIAWIARLNHENPEMFPAEHDINQVTIDYADNSK